MSESWHIFLKKYIAAVDEVHLILLRDHFTDLIT